MFFKLFNRVPTKRKSFSKDERGIAAVEFVLVVPIIVILLLGSIDAVFALTANRKVSLATHSMADIAARETDVSTSLEAISDLGKVIMTPNDVNLAEIVLSGAEVDPGGATATVAWSEAFGDTNPPALVRNSTINLPVPLTPGIFLVVASTTLPYETLTSVMFNLTETAYFQSRSGEPIIGP